MKVHNPDPPELSAMLTARPMQQAFCRGHAIVPAAAKPAGGHLVPAIPLDAVDAFELPELLRLLSHWLESHHDNLAASLARFVGSPAYSPGTLHDDIARFRFLLGTTDGEGLFTPDEP